MTSSKENGPAVSGGTLLTAAEQVVCEQVATGKAPHSHRALALLALNEGSTRAQAAAQAGLSLGQVNYWIAKFRKQRLDIFPGTLLAEPEVEAEAEPVIEIEVESEVVIEAADPVADKTTEAKSKKGKQAKPKTKKDKMDKQSQEKKKTKKKSVKVKKTKKDKKSKKEKKGKGAKSTEKEKKNKKSKKAKNTKKTKKKSS